MEIKEQEKQATKNVWISWFYWSATLVLITVPYAAMVGGDEHWIWARNWSYVFISLAGIFKAFMDTLQFHFDKSKFSNLNKYFWNPEFSWLNKYEEKNRVDFVRKKWLKFIPVPILLTDAWHLFQSFQINLIILSVVFYQEVYNVWIDFIIYSFLYRAFFYISYKHYLVKK